MNLDFSDEQNELRAEFARFLAAQDSLAAMRSLLAAPQRGYDARLWQTISAQGWVGAAIPVQYGGLGLGPLELCVIAEELGRTLAPVPFSSSVYLFADVIARHGSDAQRSAWLPRIASGETIGCLAVQQGPGDIDPVAAPVARAADNLLTGSKWPVTDGLAAHVAIVIATGADGPQLFIVDLARNCTRQTLTSIDPSKGLARFDFAGARADPLGTAAQAPAILRDLLDRAAVLIAFEQLGGADRCLEMATEFAKHRVAFGRPIGGFQAMRHKLADLYIHNQLARSHAYYGAWALATNAPQLPRAAAAARLAATTAYWEAAKENLHTHGGIGFTWEADCHLFYRRAEQLALMLGGSRYWRERLIGELLAQQGEAD